ncbi:hypothetical protein OJJOAM_001846 [Cupriavidus sp. H18C1]
MGTGLKLSRDENDAGRVRHTNACKLFQRAW